MPQSQVSTLPLCPFWQQVVTLYLLAWHPICKSQWQGQKKTSSSALFLLVCHTLIKEVFTWLIGALGKLVEGGVRVIFLLNQNSQGFKKESLDIFRVLKQDLFPPYFLPVIYLTPKDKWHWVTIVLELEVNWGDCMSCNSHGQYEQKSNLKIIFLLHFALVCI